MQTMQPAPLSDTPTEITLNEAGLVALAADLGALLVPGDVVALHGDLGTGKTTFARALIQSLLDRAEEVPSPTFTLVQTYDTSRGTIWHADLYRLTDPNEVVELGLTDAFSNDIALVEWPDRLGPYLPDSRIDMTLAHVSDPAVRHLSLGPARREVSNLFTAAQTLA